MARSRLLLLAAVTLLAGCLGPSQDAGPDDPAPEGSRVRSFTFAGQAGEVKGLFVRFDCIPQEAAYSGAATLHNEGAAPSEWFMMPATWVAGGNEPFRRGLTSLKVGTLGALATHVEGPLNATHTTYAQDGLAGVFFAVGLLSEPWSATMSLQVTVPACDNRIVAVEAVNFTKARHEVLQPQLNLLTNAKAGIYRWTVPTAGWTHAALVPTEIAAWEYRIINASFPNGYSATMRGSHESGGYGGAPARYVGTFGNAPGPMELNMIRTEAVAAIDLWHFDWDGPLPPEFSRPGYCECSSPGILPV